MIRELEPITEETISLIGQLESAGSEDLRELVLTLEFFLEVTLRSLMLTAHQTNLKVIQDVGFDLSKPISEYDDQVRTAIRDQPGSINTDLRSDPNYQFLQFYVAYRFLKMGARLDEITSIITLEDDRAAIPIDRASNYDELYILVSQVVDRFATTCRQAPNFNPDFSVLGRVDSRLDSPSNRIPVKVRLQPRSETFDIRIPDKGYITADEVFERIRTWFFTPYL